MKLKVLSLAFALILFCSSIPLAVEAQSNHSLEWGVDIDDEFTYVLQRAYFADPSYIPSFAVSLPFVSEMVVGEKYGEILGVHMYGNPSSEIIYGAAMAIEMEMRVKDMQEIIFPHPTVSEIFHEIVFE